jgi:hypothetical protein
MATNKLVKVLARTLIGYRVDERRKVPIIEGKEGFSIPANLTRVRLWLVIWTVCYYTFVPQPMRAHIENAFLSQTATKEVSNELIREVLPTENE